MRQFYVLVELIVAQRGTVGLNAGSAGKGRPKISGADEEPPKDERPTVATDSMTLVASPQMKKDEVMPAS